MKMRLLRRSCYRSVTLPRRRPSTLAGHAGVVGGGKTLTLVDARELMAGRPVFAFTGPRERGCP